MSVDTHGKIKGFVRHEEILNFIRQRWDKNAKDYVEKRINHPISECKWNIKVNEHSEDNENRYTIDGFISFKYNGEDRMMFYMYENINHLENIRYYVNHGLKDMALSETTYLSLGCWGSSVEIIKEIVAHFGGGWIDENDCDNKVYYPIDADNKTIEPVQFKVGEIVAIPTQESFYVGEIKELDTHLGIDMAWVNVLGKGEVLYSIDQLKHCDLRKLIVE